MPHVSVGSVFNKISAHGESSLVVACAREEEADGRQGRGAQRQVQEVDGGRDERGGRQDRRQHKHELRRHQLRVRI